MDRACNSQAIVASIVVNRFIDQFDFSSLHVPQLIKVQQEVRQISDAIGYVCPELRQALDRLGAELETAAWQRKSPLATRQGKQDKRLLRLLKFLTSISLVIGTVSGMTAQSAYAAAVVMPAIGDKVRNPKTNQDEEVVAIIGGAPAVLTKENNIIFLADEVGDTYSITADNVTKNYTVIAVDDGKVNVQDEDDSIIAGITIVTDATPPTPPAAGGENGSGETTVNFPVPAGNEQKQDIRAGISGGSGRDGGGVNLCVPFTDICTFAGYPPTAGGAGANGPTFSVTIGETEFGGEIASNADKLPGIKIASIGGNGGSGGDSYALGGYAGQAGGTAGNGGTVSATNRVNISTSGDGSHGMWVFSQAGKAGAGGDGYIATGGGGGGPAAGGSATGTNHGDITTQGVGATGLLVQSLGGSGGEGGSSFGVVGSAGAGNVGGNGGTASAVNHGIIRTRDKFSHGVQAQSLGGNGGSSGDSGGLVAFGASGGGAGTGGNASIALGATSEIHTLGDHAHGAFAQSIGGGGGSTGISGGVASFGSSAGSGGRGGNASVTTAAGSVIITSGVGSYGIFAESVGGNGGTAGGSGGAFTMGGTGGNGNIGGTVIIDQAGSVITANSDARGVFAQSVGGGGGNANASGAVVSLGGSGGSGGDGGDVTILLHQSSSVSTAGKGADGVFAQSIGGGGGAGAASGGLVALGGSGDVGGAGGDVLVTNHGLISTTGVNARGLLAQ